MTGRASRRAVLAALAAVPALAVAGCPQPAPAAAPPRISDELRDLIARYKEAERTFVAGPCVEDDPKEAAFLEALEELDNYAPRDADEFLVAFAERFSDDMLPTEDHVLQLIERAQHLTAEVR